MSTRATIEALRRRAASLTPPVLSLYLPAAPDTGDRWAQIRTRARSALSSLPIPPALQNQVMSTIEAHPIHGRTLVLFHTSAGEELSTWLPVLISTGEDESRPFCRWGQPDTTPLLVAESSENPLLVLWVDRDHYRLIELDFGEAELDRRATRPASPNELDALQTSKQDHPAELTRQFLQRAAAALVARWNERSCDVALMGTTTFTSMLALMLPDPVRRAIIAHVPGPPSHDASRAEIAARVDALIVARREARQRELIGVARARGICGIDDVLKGVQEGRLAEIVVPFPVPDVQVFRDPQTGYVARTPGGARLSGAATKSLPLPTALTWLSQDYAADLRFVTGAEAHAVRTDLGGLAGLPRF